MTDTEHRRALRELFSRMTDAVEGHITEEAYWTRCVHLPNADLDNLPAAEWLQAAEWDAGQVLAHVRRARHRPRDLSGMPDKSARRRRTQAEMQDLRDALFDAAEREQPVTVRRLFYVLVGEGLIEKTENEYQNVVVRLTGLMREAGELPFEWLTDHTRYMRKPTSFASLGSALEATSALYRRALWDEQGAYVEIWCEKAGLVGALYSITAEWDVPLMICGGQPSKTFLHEAALQIRAQHKPAFIYYLGDHDPTGVVIGGRVERDLKRYAKGAEIHFEKLAVTPAQIEELNLPTRPTKRSDPNAKRFEGESVEVDALPTPMLREMCEACISRHIDADALSALMCVERAERESLCLVAGNWDAALAGARGAA